jgi:hypothetical protein
MSTTEVETIVQELDNQLNDPTQIVYPPHIQKFQDKMDFMKQRLLANKKEADETLNDFKQLE